MEHPKMEIGIMYRREYPPEGLAAFARRAGALGEGLRRRFKLSPGDRVALASVGDSRIYRMRDGSLELLTQDDTWLATVLGIKEAEEAHPEHPLRHVLTSVVGTKDDVKPGAREEALQPGDRFVMCTDGVHGKLDLTTLTRLLASTTSAQDGATTIVDEAITRGTTDNATALVINVT